jgi:DNA-binding NarL/FixJ family response regulator
MRVLLVEDNAHVREELKRCFERTTLGRSLNLELVAVCATATEAQQAIESDQAFEIALVDLGLPDRSGVEVIRVLRAQRAHVTAVAFTVHDDAPTVFAALRAGARGYLLKDTPPEKLVACLKEAHEGGAPMTPGIARLVIDSFNTTTAKDTDSGLTARELEILGLLAKGLTYQEVGQVLTIGIGTVQGHVKSIYRKLEVNSKAEATAVAISRGLLVK